MSDTPETDSNEFDGFDGQGGMVVSADFARRLEQQRDESRELSEKRRKSLSDFIDLNNELRRERDEARAEVARLRAALQRLADCDSAMAIAREALKEETK